MREPWEGEILPPPTPPPVQLFLSPFLQGLPAHSSVKSSQGLTARSSVKSVHRTDFRALLTHSGQLFFPQQFLYFFPLPQGQGSLRPTLRADF